MDLQLVSRMFSKQLLLTTVVRPRQAERRPGKAVLPDVRPDARPDVRPDARPDARPEVRLEVRSDARPDVQPDVWPNARPGLGLARPNTSFAHTWFEDTRV